VYDSGKASGSTLGYDSGSDSAKVPGSDSAKESGTISGKNLGKRPDKNSGKVDGQDKNVQDKETSLLRVRDLFIHVNIKFIQDRFNKEIKLNPSQIKGSIRVEGGDLKESEPRRILR
jgi:hypothetical protein